MSPALREDAPFPPPASARGRAPSLPSLALAALIFAVCGLSQRAVANPVPTERLIAVGDSITEGIGATDPDWSYAALLYRNDTVRYPREADRDLVHFIGPHLRYVNVAHSGDTSTMVVSNQLPRLLADPQQDGAGIGPFPVHGHTLVVLTIGGNDMRYEIGPTGISDHSVLRQSMATIRQIFAFFADRERFPDGVTLYYGTLYDVTDGTDDAFLCLGGLAEPGFAANVALWSDTLESLAAEPHGDTLTVIPVHLLELFRGHGFHYSEVENAYYSRYDPTLWLSDRDCIHPNNRGHHELRRAFWRAITAP